MTGASFHLLDLQFGHLAGPPTLRVIQEYPHTWQKHSSTGLFHAYEPHLGHLTGLSVLFFHLKPHLLQVITDLSSKGSPGSAGHSKSNSL